MLLSSYSVLIRKKKNQTIFIYTSPSNYVDLRSSLTANLVPFLLFNFQYIHTLRSKVFHKQEISKPFELLPSLEMGNVWLFDAIWKTDFSHFKLCIKIFFSKKTFRKLFDFTAVQHRESYTDKVYLCSINIRGWTGI